MRKLARRYKTQTDELAKEKEELNKKLTEERPPAEQTENENAIKTLAEEKKALEDEMVRITQNFNTTKVRNNFPHLDDVTTELGCPGYVCYYEGILRKTTRPCE